MNATDTLIKKYQDELEFLDGLRESGITNMFGARPYLQQFMDSEDDELARAILAFWMMSFGYRHGTSQELNFNVPTLLIDRIGIDSAAGVLTGK